MCYNKKMNQEKTNSQVNNTKYYLLVIILCVLALAPLLIIGLYNRASADDYNFALLTHQALENKEGLFGLIKAAFITDIKYYYSWQGTYTYSFINSLEPGIYGEKLYCLTPFIIMGYSFICSFVSIKIINKHYLKYSKMFPLAFSLLIITYIFLWLQSPTQGLYWFCGSGYTLCIFSIFLNVCLCIEMLYSESKKRQIILTIVMSIFSFLISGGAQATAFSNLMFLFYITLYFVFKKKNYFTIFPLVIGAIGFLIVYFAPGTSVRMGAFQQATILEAVFKSLLQTFKDIRRWTASIYLLGLIIMTPIAIRFAKNNPPKGKNKFPFITILLSVTIIWGMLFVPYYIMLQFGDGRLTNTVWITFILLSWFNYFLIIRWVYYSLFANQKDGDFLETLFKGNVKIVFTIIFILMLVCMQNNGYSSVSIIASKELISGKAKEYASEQDKRTDLIKNTKNGIIEIEPLNVKSELLFFNDINGWTNSVGKYYGKTVKLK